MESLSVADFGRGASPEPTVDAAAAHAHAAAPSGRSTRGRGNLSKEGRTLRPREFLNDFNPDTSDREKKKKAEKKKTTKSKLRKGREEELSRL